MLHNKSILIRSVRDTLAGRILDSVEFRSATSFEDNGSSAVQGKSWMIFPRVELVDISLFPARPREGGRKFSDSIKEVVQGVVEYKASDRRLFEVPSIISDCVIAAGVMEVIVELQVSLISQLPDYEIYERCLKEFNWPPQQKQPNDLPSIYRAHDFAEVEAMPLQAGMCFAVEVLPDVYDGTVILWLIDRIDVEYMNAKLFWKGTAPALMMGTILTRRIRDASNSIIYDVPIARVM